MSGVQFDIRVNTHGGVAEVSAVERAMQNAGAATNTWQSRLQSLGNMSFHISNIGNAINGVASKLQSAWSLVSQAMDFGAMKTSFEVLAGNAEKGRKLANDLNDIQQKTILGPEVFQAAQTMQGFGIETSKVVGYTKMLGDVAMGNAEKFQSLSLVFSQTQATGKLMGQDLMQYINAGFNPLSVISEKWQEFGLKSKMSVGQLKEMMEKGQISSGMITKSFEVATSQGGRFANMMDTIGETSYGKMKQLEGSWENLKISAGQALMPMAESLMDVASKTMDWLGITKTAPEVLAGEEAGINSLVGQITVLNEGNAFRHDLLNKLIKSYPDLFKGIDIEKVKNSELVDKLKEVNQLYKERIGLATNELVADTQSKLAKEAFGEYVRYQAIADAYGRGDDEGAKSLKKWDEGSLFENATMSKQDYYQGLANKRKGTYDLTNTAASQAQQRADAERNALTVRKAVELANSAGPNDIFGSNSGKRKEFLDEVKKLSPLASSAGFGNGNIPGFNNDFIDSPNAKKLEELMSTAVDKIDPASNTITEDKKSKKKQDAKTAKETASNITSGGQRATHIDLRIGNLVNDFTLHTTNLQTGSKESAKVIVSMILEELQGMNQALEPS